MPDTPAERDRSDDEQPERDPGGHLSPESPAVGVEEVIEFFDREPPERPVSDAGAQPPG
jgi:hypothetical protein